MTPKSKVTPRQAAAMLPALQQAKPRRRGRGNPDATKPYRWQKGQSGNPGGKPKTIQKFSAMVAAELMEPCPAELLKPLGLRKGASMHAAMIRAQVIRAAQGNTESFVVCRETIEGKLINRSVQVSASLEALQNDPNFVSWLEEHHSQYLMEVGSGRQTIEAASRSLPEPADSASVQED